MVVRGAAAVAVRGLGGVGLVMIAPVVLVKTAVMIVLEVSLSVIVLAKIVRIAVVPAAAVPEKIVRLSISHHARRCPHRFRHHCPHGCHFGQSGQWMTHQKIP